MRIMVSGATKTVQRLSNTKLGRLYLGHLFTPQDGNSFSNLRSGLPWACDNSAYSDPDDIKFWNLCIDCWEIIEQFPPEWIAVPDCVGDHRETLRMFHLWFDYLIDEIGYIPFKLCFVLQNGSKENNIPWDLFDAVFVGGDDDFKLKQCHRVAHAAKERSKILHVGRVNTLQRLRYAMKLGADSVDGTNFSMFSDAKLPRALAEIHSESLSPSLF